MMFKWKTTKLRSNTTKKSADDFFKFLCFISACVVMIIFFLFFWELLLHSILAIKKFGLSFLVSGKWDPVRSEFGAWPSIYGTVVSSVIAITIAVPMSFLIAFFLAEIASPIVSRVVGEALDLLAAIPSIIYGMWGLFVFAPFMQDNIQPFLNSRVQPIIDEFARILGGLFGINLSIPIFSGAPMGIGMLNAGLILALMVLPFISAIMRDVFKMTPSVLKESAFGVGATRWEVVLRVTSRYGAQGILGGIFLGFGRAIGETMAVTFVIGNAQHVSFSLFAPGTTIASTLASQFSEAVSQPIFKSVLLELGLILFLVSFSIQIIAQLWLNKIKEKSGCGL
jgi:phosphate transport system permease protein